MASKSRKTKKRDSNAYGMSPVANYKLTQKQQEMLFKFMQGNEKMRQYGVVWTDHLGAQKYFPVMKVTGSGTYKQLTVAELNRIQGNLNSNEYITERDFFRELIQELKRITTLAGLGESLNIQDYMF